MNSSFKFNRMELAGSLGDLGTLLPIAMGMILVDGLSPSGIFFAAGIFYILSGLYYGVTVPVQPMKVIGAYAIAMSLTAQQIMASALLMGIFLLLIGITGAISLIGRLIAKPVIRGVQVSTGILLMAQGIRFMVGTSRFQLMKHAAEPFLKVQALGPVPIGMVIGVVGAVVTLLLLDNKRLPAGLVTVLGGIGLGAILGVRQGWAHISLGFYLPDILPFGFPGSADLGFALMVLVLPQIPMTIGNAVLANADLSRQYFGERSKKVTYRASCISMALANFLSFLVGGMPLCHGAGGLAAHYRFGARTAGSNLLIGSIFILLALSFGAGCLYLFYLIPMSVLGILLLFAGSQLALTIADMRDRRDLFVVMVMVGITLASNLAAGFIAGIVISYVLRSKHFTV